MRMKRARGFTIVEVIIAILILTVGILGLVTTAALVTRMIARGQRSATAATYAAQRMEKLRVTGCTSQSAGSEDLFRGSQKVATSSWSFVNLGNSAWRVVIVTRYLTTQNRWRSDTAETQISCIL
ncbi:MAG TPA: prepilin-type N-terminal cleavage/methylation domain-containing protein [Gemmatimonadales bacterium]|nr:prepilin-type N-terminal cleavage/methylation domain-containing protein [Gemmatimonadales bacterium]